MERNGRRVERYEKSLTESDDDGGGAITMRTGRFSWHELKKKKKKTVDNKFFQPIYIFVSF